MSVSRGTQSRRAPRPKTKHFSASDAVADLDELLQKRDPGYQWDGTSANDAPAERRVYIYREPLGVVLKHARTGFPAQGDMERLFEKAQMKYSILEATGRPVPRQCTDAASEFRKLAKVVYDFARVGTQHADIQHLIDMIILPEARDPASGSHVGELPSPQC